MCVIRLFHSTSSSSSAIIAFSGLTDPPSAFFVVENELNLFDRNILIALFYYYLFQIKNSIEHNRQKIRKNQSNMARIYTQDSNRAQRQSCARVIVGAI
jgi:hypothetical protein